MTTDAPAVDALTRWSAAVPPLAGSPEQDAAELARYVGEGEELLAALPAKPRRDISAHRVADQVLTSCRLVRDRFVNRHAEHVYGELTGPGRAPLRLAELAFAAADQFPGLAPTRAQLAQERRLSQPDKEGREIDQGILFRGLLRAPGAGAHLSQVMRTASPSARAALPEFRAAGRLELGVVLIERRSGAAYLTIHNEHSLNAEDDALIEQLETAVDLALLDDEVRVGVLRGAPMTHRKYQGKRVFSAGINLRDLHAGRISFVDFLLRREMGYLAKFMHGLAVDADQPATGLLGSVHKPWIAVVDSFAIGGGMQLLLAMDHVIAADDAYFSLPAAQEGIVPGVANLRLTRLVGARLARQIILSGRKIRAAEPAGLLLCDEVLPAAQLDEALARAVLALGSPAVVANRRMLHLAEEPPDSLRAYLADFALTQALRMYSEDVLHAVGARWSS